MAPGRFPRAPAAPPLESYRSLAAPTAMALGFRFHLIWKLPPSPRSQIQAQSPLRSGPANHTDRRLASSQACSTHYMW